MAKTRRADAFDFGIVRLSEVHGMVESRKRPYRMRRGIVGVALDFRDGSRWQLIDDKLRRVWGPLNEAQGGRR